MANVIALRPVDLLELPPAWESRLGPGELGVAVIDGDLAEWEAVERCSHLAACELDAAPVITLGVIRGAGAISRAPNCDLLVCGDDPAMLDACVERLLTSIEHAGPPALVASQLLRAGGSLIAEASAYSMLMSGEPFRMWRDSSARRRSDDSGQPRVSVEQTERAWVVRLTRMHRHNAFDAAMREELCDALDAIAHAGLPSAPVALLGDGPSFCSGGDLDEFGTAASPLAAYLVRTSRSVARRLARLGERLVAGVHGHCIGAGIELAAFARTVIATHSATFSLPELGLGLGLGAGGSRSIPARIGRHRTLELLLAGGPIDAERALAWGLVDELVAEDELESCALARAEALA